MRRAICMTPRTTLYGGDLNCSAGLQPGCGVVFKLSKGGAFTVLYSFAGGSTDGSLASGLFRDSKGNRYGTTRSAAVPAATGRSGRWIRPTRRPFCTTFGGGKTGGWGPLESVVRDAAGNLYGTTENGGAGQCGSGCGTVFKLATTGKSTVLHSFEFSDGTYPVGELIWDGKGKLYGTASEGGPANYGTVWKLTP
jgi:uncharacterized repeat protein (TIGR03803 family)